ncbi:MAG: glucosamine-6-phosphate deaminase [Planctomycetes bacterium SM23_25]|jgi:glucosamine-6-phosphate deaminase|nr:MAG: glucosamine-6-phosphate deaminase [Planctomycetes bacterium SM23_25]
MKVAIYETVREMAEAAAALAAGELSRHIAENGRATFMAATGASQFAFLDALSRQSHVDWARTEMFHLDEYIGLPESHPASFRRYLRERLLDVVRPGRVHLINGNAADPCQECARLERLMLEDGVDVAFVGIGENGHLAFNGPPADLATDGCFTVVSLTDSCRAQQLHEGWFGTIQEVPNKAITVTVRGILKSKCIVSVVPEARKAVAVRCALSGLVSPTCPASVLVEHPRAYLFLDADAASLLDKATIHRWQRG